MTITTRSKRVSPFAAAGHRHHATPATVGPGAYSPEKTLTSFHNAVNADDDAGGAGGGLTGSGVATRPLFSGFATSEKRHLNENRTTSAYTPGPGAYSSSPASTPNANAPSNVFATKISRFAPSAPGSTIFRPSSIQDNPGPGSYDIASNSTNNQHTHEPQPSSATATVPLSALMAANAAGKAVTAPVPAIPKKDQSYGYVRGEDGALRRQAPPAAIYSGVGSDTVGPAAYSAHPPNFYDAKRNAAPSLRSTVQREVWADNLTPRREVPGPGAYDPHRMDAEAAKGDEEDAGGDSGRKESEPKRWQQRHHRRHHREQRPSAVFASKVPLLPSPKPVAQFNAERELELQAKEARARPRVDARRRRTQGAKVEAFGSTTTRVELTAQQDGPIVFAPTFLTTPGPGMYRGSDGVTSTGGTSLLGYSAHGRSSLPAGRRREIDGVGFSSASERACLAQPRRNLNNEVIGASLGPGAYRSETPRSLDYSVRSKLAVGRLGVFGSTAPRDVWDALDPITGGPKQSALNPGPGAYDSSQPTPASAGEMSVVGASSAVFKSSSLRFAKGANNPHMHRVGDCATPGVGEYDLLAAPDSVASKTASSSTAARRKIATSSPRRRVDGSVTSALPSSPVNAPTAPFLSTAERAVFDAREAADAPGPGSYESTGAILGMAVGGNMNTSGAGAGLTRSLATRATLGNEERFRVNPTVPPEVGPGAYAIRGTVGTRSFNVTMAGKR